MTTYTVTWLEPYVEPGADASGYQRFRVTEGGDSLGVMQARASRSLMASGNLDGTDWPNLLSLAVLQEGESQLRAGILSREDGASLEITYGSWDHDFVAALRGQPKPCEWRGRAETKGSVCLATAEGRPEPTTQALCESCDMPDSRLVCSALVHPVVAHVGAVGVYPGDGGPGFASQERRSIGKAHCEVSVGGEKWVECLPGRKDCWRRVVETGIWIPAFDESSPAKLVDEIPYLRLAYADRFETRGSAFWPTADERVVAAILTPCETPEAFQQNIAALDSALTRVNPYGQLRDERRIDGSGNRIGSIRALRNVLEDRCGGMGLEAVDKLRALHRARNSFPAHPSSDVLASALRVLGVDHYPPRDWRLAWWQIAATIAEAIRQVRLAVQTSQEDSGSTVGGRSHPD